MLDPARHFMPVPDVCRVIEAAAACGMNRMHWHLTDDQGWRLEIKKYPLLTRVGAVRGPSYFGDHVSETENNCGFYTQREVRDIVAFARGKGIEIVPEIEVPGHASAMLAAYPEFGCRRALPGPDGEEIDERPYPYHVMTYAGIFPNLICAGKESAVRFLKDILDEVVDLFPGPEVHIGGDEAVKMHWRRCPDCQKRMREEGLSDERALQRSLVLEIGEYLAEKGRKTIVWNESLEGGGLPPHFIVQHWMGGKEETRAFMAGGGPVICSDAEN
jgi:hexosaminidase